MKRSFLIPLALLSTRLLFSCEEDLDIDLKGDHGDTSGIPADNDIRLSFDQPNTSNVSGNAQGVDF